MATFAYKIKRSAFVRSIFIGFKRFISIFLFPQVIVKACRIIFHKTTKTKIVVALIDHIGDIVASEPIDRFIKEKDSYAVRIIKTRYKEVIQYNPNVDEIVTVGCLSEWIYLRFFLRHFSIIKIIDLHVDQRVCFRHYLTIHNPNRAGITMSNYFDYGSLLEVFSLTAGLPKLNSRPIYYLPQSSPPTDLPEKYIVIHTMSNGDSKSWTSEKWNDLANQLILQGNYIVEIGLTARVHNDSTKFINLCGKLSLTEIAFIVKKCFLFIGIDSSFAHFAHALNVKKRVILLGDLFLFKNYNPYSGLTRDEIENFILRHNGPLNELPAEVVFKKIGNQLT